METISDTWAIIGAVIGTGISLWRINKASMDRLHNDIGSVKDDIGELRERMARLEDAVDVLTKLLTDRQPKTG